MKTNKARILTLALAMLMVLSLTACALPFDIPGFNNPTETPTEEPTEAPTVPEVTYTVNFYYESTELGTYDAPVSTSEKALQGTKVTAPDGAKTGFVLNAETSVQSIDAVTEGAQLNVYFDRIRVEVKFDYISKEAATYTAAYGVGLIEDAQLTDRLVLLPADAYLNGTKTELTADSFKALTENATVTFEPVAGDWSYEEGYVPANAESSYLYAPAVAGNQSFTTTLNLSTMENAISSTGIAVRSGEEVVVLYITGSGKNLNLIFGGIDGSVTGLLSENATTFVDGACKITATIYDGMLYISINDVDCGSVALSSALPSYTAESEVAIGLYANNAANGLASFTDVAHSTAVEPVTSTAIRWEQKITFVPELAVNVKVNFVNASFASIPGQLNRVTLAGASKTWEVSGTAERLTDNLKAEDFCIGFMIQSGEKTLRMSATREGLVFESHDGHGRYAYHAFGLSQYNLNNKTKFFSFGEQRTQSKMHFKVQIIDDVFYAYYWFDGEEPTLCWYVPLTEKLTGVDGGAAWTDNPFTGFAAGSEYKLHIFNNATSTPGQFSNLVVKNGESVDTMQAPAWAALTNKVTVDEDGTINSIPSCGADGSVKFAGNSTAWEVSGQMERLDDADAWTFGFNIRSGGKSLRISAVTSGLVFEAHSGHGRYAYNAFGTSKYNFNADVNKFLAAKTESKMYFKAMIANDMFYVWFWYEGQEPVLSWVIPLTETLTGTGNSGQPDWTDNPFTGFTAGSSYTFELYLRNTAAAGRVNDLTIKTGAAVDTSVIPTPAA